MDVSRIRDQFPALNQTVHGKPLRYFDNAATSQKPRSVLDRVNSFYESSNANVHRGVHTLSERATEAYEQARETVRDFLNAESVSEIVFTKGCTEGINLVASSWGRHNLGKGDRILLPISEHHSNIVPWQLIATEVGAVVEPLPIELSGEIDLSTFQRLLNDSTKPNVKMVALAHAGNALGIIHPLKRVIELAQAHGARVLVDGAQSGAHLDINVQDLGADFYTLSGHKMFGPMGIGVLYGKASLLNSIPPYQGGGDMIRSVSFAETTFDDAPRRFEAGTPPIAAAVGLAEAIRFIKSFDRGAVAVHEKALLDRATKILSEVKGVRLFGTVPDKTPVLSFLIDHVHPHDIGTIFDCEFGIAIRTGHHCCMPLMEHFGTSGTARLSFAVYNTIEELNSLAEAVHRVRKVFHVD